MLHKMILTIILTMISFGIFAQEITGFVKDRKNQEPVPFSNIWVKGSTRGTMSDVNGQFILKLSEKDTLCISSVGYRRWEIPAKNITENPLVVFLDEEVQELGEITVKPEISRAKVLLKKIQERKKENRENIQKVSDFKTFERTTVYLAVDSASRANRIIGNPDEVTLKLDGQSLRFSPIYLAELGEKNVGGKDSVVYNRKDGIFPKLNQTIESLILLNVVIDMDFYRDQINILGRGITSPLNNSAQLFYDFFLNDSTFIGDTKYFSFSFTPKNKYNPLFTGRFTVEDSTFALSSIYAYVQEEANINFVNGFKANVNYSKTGNDTWFYNSQEISLNMALSLNKDTVSKYGSQRIDEISGGNWLVTKTTQYSISQRLDEIRPRNWKNQPEFESSNHFDEGTYMRVDKLKENPVVQGIDAVGGMVLTSYIDCGKIEIGPVFDIYSKNAIEGQRFSLPLRTGEKMFERFFIGGLLGYGTKSNELKFGVNMAWQPLPTDKFIFRASYSDDYNLVSQDKYLRFIKKNPNTRGNGNFIAALTGREENPFLKEEKSFSFIMEYNSPGDICIEVSPYYLYSKSTPDVRFIRDKKDYNHYSNYGILLNTRLAFGQHYDEYYFARVYYINETPVVNLSLDVGQAKLPGSSTDDFGLYAQLHGSVSGKVNLGQVFMRYMVNGGYLFGDAPYDLLDQPAGSMSLGYSKYGYNLLHHVSFVHNLYTNIHLDFNGGGVILNRIPLIKKLKLREMASLKSHYGKLTGSYYPVFGLPGYYTTDMGKPYAEIGFGLTNIFKVLRVEYVRQLGGDYTNMGFADKNGIFFRAEMSF
ncbi:MAG: carboxypeptidase-like regulatory domain-containing protein [Bacteroidia bacterium]|nr:carboxypeptidase-like regulatory domain-containing protein [Bacteroidia bacterium]